MKDNSSMSEQHYQAYLERNHYPRSLQKVESTLLNFSSNDYLNLSHHPLLVARSHEYAKKWGVGAKSSRLVTGNLDICEELEAKIARLANKPAALILGSGYQANQSVLQAILNRKVLGEKPLVFADRYCHVSLLNGLEHSSRLHRFHHNDLNHLKTDLAHYAGENTPKFILAESLYSMDGDQANIEELSYIAQQSGALLYIDDAHAVGVYGNNGFGYTADFPNKIDMVMGSFSKALGSYGGYIACSDVIKNYLVNTCRGLIYSTAVSPALLGAMDAALELLPTLDEERKKLMNNAQILRDFFHENQLQTESTTHILPWVIGDANKTLQISVLLREQGIVALPIRPPSVPAGSSRIRICLNVKHSDAELEQLMQAIRSTFRYL